MPTSTVVMPSRAAVIGPIVYGLYYYLISLGAAGSFSF